MLMAPLSVNMDDQDFTDTPLNAFTALPASRFERYARMARRLFDVHAVQVSSLDINQLWLGDPPVMPLDGARKRRARVSGGRRRPALKVVTPQAAPAASRRRRRATGCPPPAKRDRPSRPSIRRTSGRFPALW